VDHKPQKSPDHKDDITANNPPDVKSGVFVTPKHLFVGKFCLTGIGPVIFLQLLRWENNKNLVQVSIAIPI
jgi:hypothetical protein